MTTLWPDLAMMPELWPNAAMTSGLWPNVAMMLEPWPNVAMMLGLWPNLAMMAGPVARFGNAGESRGQIFPQARADLPNLATASRRVARFGHRLVQICQIWPQGRANWPDLTIASRSANPRRRRPRCRTETRTPASRVNAQVSHRTDAADAVRKGREAFTRRAWGEAYTQLSAADRAASLDIADLERLAASAYLIGKDQVSDDLWVRAHNECLRSGDVPRAVRCSFWLVLDLLTRGEAARAGGWLARAQRLLDDGHHDCPERGLLLLLAARVQVRRGDPESADDTAGQAVELSRRFEDPELRVFGRPGWEVETTRSAACGGPENSSQERWAATRPGTWSSISSPPRIAFRAFWRPGSIGFSWRVSRANGSAEARNRRSLVIPSEAQRREGSSVRSA